MAAFSNCFQIQIRSISYSFSEATRLKRIASLNFWHLSQMVVQFCALRSIRMDALPNCTAQRHSVDRCNELWLIVVLFGLQIFDASLVHTPNLSISEIFYNFGKRYFRYQQKRFGYAAPCGSFCKITVYAIFGVRNYDFSTLRPPFQWLYSSGGRPELTRSKTNIFCTTVPRRKSTVPVVLDLRSEHCLSRMLSVFLCRIRISRTQFFLSDRCA